MYNITSQCRIFWKLAKKFQFKSGKKMISYISLLEGNCNLFNLEQSCNSILSRDVLKDQVTKSFVKKPYFYTFRRWKLLAITGLHEDFQPKRQSCSVCNSLFFNQYPTYMRNMFVVRHTTYNLRAVPICWLWASVEQQPMDYTPFQQWNALPDELRNSTFPDFKRRLISFTNFGLALCVSFRDRNFFLEDISYIA